MCVFYERVTLLDVQPYCISGDLISRKKLSWPLLCRAAVQLLNKDNTSWQLTLFSSLLIWNASSRISFKCSILRQYTHYFVNNYNQTVCFFLSAIFFLYWKRFLSPSAKIFVLRISSHSQVLFCMFPHKADYDLSFFFFSNKSCTDLKSLNLWTFSLCILICPVAVSQETI